MTARSTTVAARTGFVLGLIAFLGLFSARRIPTSQPTSATDAIASAA